MWSFFILPLTVAYPLSIDDTHGAKKSRFFARLWLKTVHWTVFLTRRPVEQPHKFNCCYKVSSVQTISKQKEKNTLFGVLFFLAERVAQNSNFLILLSLYSLLFRLRYKLSLFYRHKRISYL